MDKKAYLGTFWTSKEKAEVDKQKKELRFKKTFAVMEFTNGFLVVAQRQLQ